MFYILPSKPLRNYFNAHHFSFTCGCGCDKGSEKEIAKHVYIFVFWSVPGFVYLSYMVDMFVCLHHLYHLVSLWFSRFNIEMSESLATFSMGYFLMTACWTEILSWNPQQLTTLVLSNASCSGNEFIEFFCYWKFF